MTKLLGNMFSAEGSSLAQHNPALWKAYLRRYAFSTAYSFVLAELCYTLLIIELAVHGYNIHLRTAAFHFRFEDIDLSVRLETVKTCTAFFDHQPALAEDVSGEGRQGERERGSREQENADYRNLGIFLLM